MHMRVDHQHYFHGSADDSVHRKLDSILTLLTVLARQEEVVMTTLDDLKMKLQALQEDVAAETNVVQAAKLALEGQTQMIKDLRDQLANQGVPQDVLDTVDGIIAAQTAQRETLAAAIPTGTPAEPPAAATGSGLSTPPQG